MFAECLASCLHTYLPTWTCGGSHTRSDQKEVFVVVQGQQRRDSNAAPSSVLLSHTASSLSSVLTDLSETQEGLKCRLIGTPRISHENLLFPNRK